MSKLLLIALLTVSCHVHNKDAIGTFEGHDFATDWAKCYEEAEKCAEEQSAYTRIGTDARARKFMARMGWSLHCSTCGERMVDLRANGPWEASQ